MVTDNSLIEPLHRFFPLKKTIKENRRAPGNPEQPRGLVALAQEIGEGLTVVIIQLAPL